MTYDCMSPDELALWRAGAENTARFTGYTVQKPCADCPLSYRMAEYEAGRCRLPRPRTLAETESRRAYMREWMRLARSRAQQELGGSAVGLAGVSL